MSNEEVLQVAGRSPWSADHSDSRWIVWLPRAAILVFAFVIASSPWRHHSTIPYMGMDDFFYYLKIAQNIAAGHGSTFNGIVRTNGYHPLWEAFLVAAAWLSLHGANLRFFLEFAVFAAMFGTYLFAERLLSRGGLAAIPATLAAAYITVYSTHLFIYSMEVTLVVPLILWLLTSTQEVDAWLVPGIAGYKRTLGLGLLVSAVILSRLDSALLVALLGIGFALTPSLRQRVRGVHLLGVATGLIPFIAYLLLNHAIFGVWEPVSGMAKQLKLDHGFTPQAWTRLVHKSPVALINLVPVLVALAALPWIARRMSPVQRVIALAALTFPFVYLTTLSWLSDWPLWDWYYYSFRTALCVAFLVLAYSRRVQKLASNLVVLGVSAVFVVLLMFHTSWPLGESDILTAGFKLQAFMETHPGIYAMGDRSGVVGYLSDQPIIQTEGLVMDKAFLADIAWQTPLRDVLARYHVRYYVGSLASPSASIEASAMQPFQGCFEAVEPIQAGEHSPHMRGEFCETPVAQWKVASVQTIVFDLHPEWGAASSTSAIR